MSKELVPAVYTALEDTINGQIHLHCRRVSLPTEDSMRLCPLLWPKNISDIAQGK